MLVDAWVGIYEARALDRSVHGLNETRSTAITITAGWGGWLSKFMIQRGVMTRIINEFTGWPEDQEIDSVFFVQKK